MDEGRKYCEFNTVREHHRHKASVSKEKNNRKNYQVTRNKLIKTIKTTKAAFLRKAMSSKNPKEVWSFVNIAYYQAADSRKTTPE